MKRTACLRALPLVFLLLAPPALGQEEAPEIEPPAAENIRVYLDCHRCDSDYLRTEIDFVEFVRDRADSDVHMLIARQSAGSGTEYTLYFLGQNEFSEQQDTLLFITSGTDTEDEVRERMARMLKLGLMPYVARSEAAEGIRISYDGPSAEGEAAIREEDPWNAWIFSISLSGETEGEQRRTETSFSGGISGDRVTPMWKMGFDFDADYEDQEFEVSDTSTVTSLTRDWDSETYLIRSLGPHWAAGAEASASSNTFLNRRLRYRAAPAIEYNIYPYAEATRRQLTIQYSLGAAQVDYHEMTIFQETAETLFNQELEVFYGNRQPWGSISARVGGSNYLHDFERFRFSAWGNVDLRIVRGLSLNVSGDVALVRDQLYLPAGDSPIEDILLERRQLGTNYEYETRVRISYTFGSIFNTVVNPRMD